MPMDGGAPVPEDAAGLPGTARNDGGASFAQPTSQAYIRHLQRDLERLLRYASTAKNVEIPQDALEQAAEALRQAEAVPAGGLPVGTGITLKLLKAIDGIAPRVYPATPASLEVAELMESCPEDLTPQQQEIRDSVKALIGRWRVATVSVLIFTFFMYAADSTIDKLPEPYAIFNHLPHFLMPIVFGFLGACTFILRNILQGLDARTFVLRDSTMYSLRAMLGLVLGLIMPMFVEQADGFPLKNIIVAFLAGYAVEPMFAALDNVVLTIRDAVSRGSSAAAGTPAK